MHALLIRHGPTAWNAARKLQGRADVPLSEDGRAAVARWRLPAAWSGAPAVASPLQRARETALILTGREVLTVEALVEMDWGVFEGRRLSDLREADPAGMAANEARGLDFRPPGGESYRAVRDRVCAALAELGTRFERVIVVSHKGVIRAALSAATGWDMTGPPPVRLGLGAGLLLQVAGTGGLAVAGPPVPLLGAER